jgi:ubiquinone/menaquinone biosynthesis C-methylase UbiE
LDLSRRSTEPELLDEGVAEAEALGSLRDLRWVNRWLGGRSSIVRAVLPLLRGRPAPRLLDVGCGSADLPALLVRLSGGRVRAVGVDLKPLHLKQAPAGVRPVVADVRRLPFGPASFDVVTASLFLHHFDAAEAPLVLRELYAIARGAVVVNDLRRARLPYLFGRAVFPLVFRSRVSVNDGLVSIRRAFTVEEMRQAFEDAGIHPVELRRRFPYRIVAVARKP